MDEGLSPECITLTSDGQGSLPSFDENGNFLRIGVASARSLLIGIQETVQRETIPLEIALQTVTSNPARMLKLDHKGQLAVNKDADILLLDKETLDIDTVIAKGEIMVDNGQAVRFGTFE